MITFLDIMAWRRFIRFIHEFINYLCCIFYILQQWCILMVFSVRLNLIEKMGISPGYSLIPKEDKSQLLKYLPQSQDEIPARTMQVNVTICRKCVTGQIVISNNSAYTFSNYIKICTNLVMLIIYVPTFFCNQQNSPGRADKFLENVLHSWRWPLRYDHYPGWILECFHMASKARNLHKAFP